MEEKQITLDMAKEAYGWATAETSYNDNDRYILFMQQLGFTLDELRPEEPLTITKANLYEAIDGHPYSVPSDFTDLVWTYLREIVNAR